MLARKSVLVADDDKVIAELFCKMLVFYGFDAKSCTSGESALTMAGKKCFDAALVDYYLPEANGVQLSLSLRKLCPGIVIIGMSGRYSGEDFAAVSNAFFITKPIMADRLVSLLNRALFGSP